MASLRAWDNAPADQIDHAQLPLSFGLVDAVQSVSGRHPNDEVPNSATDVAHTLASKVLHTPLFMEMEWSSLKFQPAKVFHLAGRILEGKASLPSLTMAQAITDIPTSEDPKEVAKRRTRLVAKTIGSFDARTSDNRTPITSYDSLVFTGATYMSDIAARPTRERRDIRPDVVCMVNHTGILVVNRTRGNATHVASRCVMMD